MLFADVSVSCSVFDVTKYLRLHPGGYKLLFKNAGDDSTADFVGLRHSIKAQNILMQFYVGDLSDASSSNLSAANAPAVLLKVGSAVAPQRFLSATPWESSSASASSNSKSDGDDSVAPSSIPIVSSAAFSINLLPPSPAPVSVSAPSAAMDITTSTSPVTGLSFSLISRVPCAHNVYRLVFRSAPNADAAQFVLPAGGHVLIGAIINGEYVKRPYSPLYSSDVSEAAGSDHSGVSFTVVVKCYPRGVMSQYLSKLSMGSSMEVHGPFEGGSYAHTDVPDGMSLPRHDAFVASSVLPLYDQVVMIAQGTGIAPLHSVLNYISHIATSRTNELRLTTGETLSSHVYQRLRVHMLICDRSTDDTLIGDELHPRVLQSTAHQRAWSLTRWFTAAAAESVPTVHSSTADRHVPSYRSVTMAQSEHGGIHHITAGVRLNDTWFTSWLNTVMSPTSSQPSPSHTVFLVCGSSEFEFNVHRMLRASSCASSIQPHDVYYF